MDARDVRRWRGYSRPVAATTITDVMRAYADGTVAYARRTLGVDLDYSEQSLVEVDRVLDAYAGGERIDPKELSPQDEEDVWTFCKMIGGYVGEVIARNLGGSWALRPLEGGGESVLIECGTIQGRPPDAVWEAVTTRSKRMTSYYRTLLVAIGRGTRSESGTAMQVSLPPLSTVPRRDPAR